MGERNFKIKMINYLKDKYYWFNNFRKLKPFISKIESEKILLAGHPKSGNTWLRLLLYNYRTLLLNDSVSKTITYEILNELQNNIMEKGTTFMPKDGYPFFYSTHNYNKPCFSLFTKKIFIHRNPLDTLISAYYFYKNRDIPFFDDDKKKREELYNIDFYVKNKLERWIDFYNNLIKGSDIVVNYTCLRKNCFAEFRKLIIELEWELNDDLIRKSIELSSFVKVRKMGVISNQKYGNGPKDGSFKGNFTRSGEEGQFHNELKKETILIVLNKFPEFKNLYPNLID